MTSWQKNKRSFCLTALLLMGAAGVVGCVDEDKTIGSESDSSTAFSQEKLIVLAKNMPEATWGVWYRVGSHCSQGSSQVLTIKGMSINLGGKKWRVTGVEAFDGRRTSAHMSLADSDDYRYGISNFLLTEDKNALSVSGQISGQFTRICKR